MHTTDTFKDLPHNSLFTFMHAPYVICVKTGDNAYAIALTDQPSDVAVTGMLTPHLEAKVTRLYVIAGPIPFYKGESAATYFSIELSTEDPLKKNKK